MNLKVRSLLIPKQISKQLIKTEWLGRDKYSLKVPQTIFTVSLSYKIEQYEITDAMGM